jgi:hypothetical protein
MMVGYYDKPINDQTQAKVSYDFEAYKKGFEAGYDAQLPNSKTDILNLAKKEVYPKYFVSDLKCERGQSENFGFEVGMCYRAWVYIADNITEFITVSDFLTTTVERIRLIEIHKYLSDKKYIDVDVYSWLYWFSKQTWTNTKGKPKRIKWIGAVYHLTNVVYLICGNMNIQTETAMKKAFELPKEAKFQSLTVKNIKGDFYTDLKNKIQWAERFAIE